MAEQNPPEVAYGNQHPVQPEVVVSGPLGSATVRVGGEPVPEQHPNEGEPAPEPADPGADPEPEPEAAPEDD